MEPVADGRGYPLDRTLVHITGSKRTRHARLEWHRRARQRPAAIRSGAQVATGEDENTFVALHASGSHEACGSAPMSTKERRRQPTRRPQSRCSSESTTPSAPHPRHRRAGRAPRRLRRQSSFSSAVQATQESQHGDDTEDEEVPPICVNSHLSNLHCVHDWLLGCFTPVRCPRCHPRRTAL
jgi:hypothetical protein